MSTRIFRHAALSVAITAATLTASVATPAYARPDQGPGVESVSSISGSVSSITDGLARQLASSFTSKAMVERVASAGSVDLLSLPMSPQLSSTVYAANQAVLLAKGLPADSGSLLQLRLAHPDMRAALTRGEVPLVAATPTDDTASSVTAYNPAGHGIVLDAARVPQRPVLLVEVNAEKALSLGLKLMRAELDKAGILSASATPAASSEVGTNAGYWATKVNTIRLANDQEPWLKGDAEIYSLVAGFGLDGKVKVDLVDMPYLNNDNTTYYPNQLLVHFSSYKYNLADVVMMEDDGDINYQSLVKAIVDALLVIADGGAYIPLVNAVLDAIPTSWYTDDPDYVDSWYTLATSSSGRLYGASANGWMDVVPYWVQQF